MSAEVQATGDRMVFWVQSETHPKTKYRVDLIANNGAAECSCADWQTRKGPALKAGKPKWTRETCCKHCRKAAAHFMRDLFEAMAKSESTPPPK